MAQPPSHGDGHGTQYVNNRPGDSSPPGQVGAEGAQLIGRRDTVMPDQEGHLLERDAATAMGDNLKAAAEAISAGKPAPPPRPPVIVPPAAMTGDRQVIDVGGLEVQVLFLGRAHTGGDLHVLLPRERILLMSEAYLNRVFPAMR